MPITFIHGVNVRSSADFAGIEKLLRAFVAPVLVAGTGRTADDVAINFCAWDESDAFAWGGASLPANDPAALIAMGAVTTDIAQRALPLVDDGTTLANLLVRDTAPSKQTASDLVEQGRWQAPTTLFGADANTVSALLVAALATQDQRMTPYGGQLESFPGDSAAAALALDAAARAIVPTIGPSESYGTSVDRIIANAQGRLSGPAHDAAAPADPLHVLVGETGDAVSALLGATTGPIGDAVAHCLLGARRPVSDLFARFLGMTFLYLNGRDAAGGPGRIVQSVLHALRTGHDAQPGEPYVVLTHCMGGQLLYDAITYYALTVPGYDDIRIDVWLAAACQAGIFEEMKLFKSSDPAVRSPERVALPAAIRSWYSYWDPSDVLSFRTSRIFDGVTECVFASGTSPLQAHAQYLVQPRFYRMAANAVAELALAKTGPA